MLEPPTTEQHHGLWNTVLWRYIESPEITFDRAYFDAKALRQQNLIDGTAEAGRGNTVFFTANDQPLVLRHYYRGGLVRRVSKQHYLFTGMDRTRALREFEMLVHLHRYSLPAPLPYACKVKRCGLLYQASLITHRLRGSTLAARLFAPRGNLTSESVSDDDWRSVGSAIACFHKAGVYHADLNAHNIMLNTQKGTALIDFDRSQLRPIPEQPTAMGWCLQNLQRLERSLAKLARLDGSHRLGAQTLSRKFSLCKDQWASDLDRLD